jgi:hypothetical protein
MKGKLIQIIRWTGGGIGTLRSDQTVAERGGPSDLSVVLLWTRGDENRIDGRRVTSAVHRPIQRLTESYP